MQPLLHMYSGHQAQVGSLAWSPDGTRLVSVSADGSARVWQVSQPGCVRRICKMASRIPTGSVPSGPVVGRPM